MNVVSRGIRNAFRNSIRTLSIVIILGLSIGLSLVMLIAHQAVTNKINTVKGSIGDTITIAPAGYSNFSSVNNSLTSAELVKVQSLPNITSVTETLTDRLTKIGSSTPSSSTHSKKTTKTTKTTPTGTTSLTSPITLSFTSKGGSGGGAHFIQGGGSLPTNFSTPVTVLGTNNPTSVNGSAITITSGKAFNGTSNTNDALVSGKMATKNTLKVGSTFTAYSKTITVAGIFSSSDESTQNTIIFSLPTEQRLSGQSGDVTSAAATVNSLDNLSAATTAIKNTLGSVADVTSTEAQADAVVAPLNSVKQVSLYSLIGAVIAGSMIILLTMVMIVRERRREIGVIKAIGASNLKVILQFTAEAITFTVLASVIGIALGIVAGNPVTKMLVNNSSSTTTNTTSTVTGTGGRFGGSTGRAITSVHVGISNISATIGWSIILYGLGAALVIAIIGSAIASFFIAKVRPAEVLRAE